MRKEIYVNYLCFILDVDVPLDDIPQSLQEKFAKLIELISDIAEETEKLAYGDPQAYIYPDNYTVHLKEIDGCYRLQVHHEVFYDNA